MPGSRCWLLLALSAALAFLLWASPATTAMRAEPVGCVSGTATTDVSKSPVVASRDKISDKKAGRLYALSADGDLKWAFDPARTGSQSINYGVSTRPAVGPSGAIYVASHDDHVYAVAPDGELKWSFETGNWSNFAPAIGPNGTVYVASRDSCVYALTPDGRVKWRFQMAGSTAAVPTIGPSGTIYVSAAMYDPRYESNYRGSYLYAITPEGEQKWRIDKDGLPYSAPAVGPKGTVYVDGDDGHLYALTPHGQPRWSFRSPAIAHSSPAIAPNGMLYVGASIAKRGDAYLYTLSADGVQQWSFGSGRRGMLAHAAVGPAGRIYVSTVPHVKR